MKYNVLLAFKDYLEKSLAVSTASTYYKAVDFLLKDQFLFDMKQLDINKVIIKLNAIKYKNQYSKYKNAFLKLCDYLNIKLSSENEAELNTMNHKKINKRRKLNPIEFEDIKNSIKTIRDKKLKLAFELMLASGLRVSELAQIKKEDCVIGSKDIKLLFIGKGGKSETVLLTNRQIITDLKKLLQEVDSEKRLFYHPNYLQSQALKRGFQCHDLRRAFAFSSYKEHKSIKKL